ncbi:bifunctional tetrahydrofolate synthase/dihydrofolate synthase [Shewanella sp. HL-SH8]|uniref:bifunctional tetrahydrofolate synthase/dihydrofolate synthase n=1 Tax=Shewanella sp. HL-SH8 TaxID=3436242 RepID=UPI003EBE60E8
MHTDTIIAPNKDAHLDEWLDYLLAIHPSEIDMGLARVSIVAERLALINLQPAQVITVAGTNGKGTTCAMLESILIQSGKTVGVYSSPHLLRYNERVRINQQDCTDDQFIAAFQAIEQARAEISLTFFEYATLAGLYLFKHAQLDVIILEVGLGGRLDATNMIDSTATIITSIDLDHQEYLGDTRELVGREKAGVCRSECISIIGEPNLPQSVVDYAQQISCQLIRVGHEFDYQLNNDNWTFSTHITQSPALTLPTLPLANAACVVALMDKLWPEINSATINKGLELASLPGRLECVNQIPLVLVDVAHNPHAAKYLAEQLRKKIAISGKIVAICGMLKDKDISGVFAELVDVVNHWNMVTLSTERGASSAQLIALMEPIAQNQLDHSVAFELNAFNNMNEAWTAVNATIEPNDVVIVFGSFYTVAAFKLLM